MWFYRATIGTFRIRENPDNPGSYMLSIDDIHLGDYDSPSSAAKDVYAQNTGWDEWDSLEEVSSPPDLSDWAEAPAEEALEDLGS